MASLMLTTDLTPTITLTSTPTLEQMKIWWHALQQDPTRLVAYTDFLPHELEAFLRPMAEGTLQISLFLVENVVAGAYYLHDGGIDGEGAYAWVGAYIVPSYRGRCAAAAWTMLRQQYANVGLRRMFAAIRACNRPAQCFITHALKFTRLGRYPHWSSFGGQWDDIVLYSLRRQDQRVAWALAVQRAQQFRRQRPLAAAGGDSVPGARVLTPLAQ